MNLDLVRYQNRHSLKSKIGRMLWNVVWIFLFRPTPERGFRMFNAWRIFLLRLFGAKIGCMTTVMSSVLVWQPWKLEVGDWTVLSENVNCYNVDVIRIGSRAAVSREAFLCTASHDITSPTMELISKSIEIEDDCWVCARAFVGPGVKLGRGSVVGACAVVTRDVDAWTVVGGNPAKIIKKRELRKC